MIKLTTLAKKIEDKLNSAGETTGFRFKIATDTGDFEKSIRNINTVEEVINGIMEAGTSSVTNLTNGDKDEPGMLFATQTCYLKFVVKLEDDQDDITWGDKVILGYESKLEALRDTLTSVFEHNVQDGLYDEDGKFYQVSMIFSFNQTGERSQLPVIGDSLTLSADVYFMFVENGINTRNMTFLFDGAIIPFQSSSVYRTPTMDGNVYSGTKDGATKNLVSQTTLSMSFELPALDKDNATANALDYLFSGNQKTHLLTFGVNGKLQTYLVTYGEIKLIGETMKNAGQTLAFMESPDIYELLELDESLFIYEASESVPDGSSFHVVPNTQYAILGANSVLDYTKDKYWHNQPLHSGDMIVCTAELPENEYLTKVQG